MTTNPPEPIEERFTRLESFFAGVSELVMAQNEAINALTANVNNFTEQTTRNINTLVEQAAADRQAWNDIAAIAATLLSTKHLYYEKADI